MLPKYTFALGGTNAVKELITFIESQKQVVESLLKKYEKKEDYAI